MIMLIQIILLAEIKYTDKTEFGKTSKVNNNIIIIDLSV